MMIAWIYFKHIFLQLGKSWTAISPPFCEAGWQHTCPSEYTSDSQYGGYYIQIAITEFSITDAHEHIFFYLTSGENK